MADSMARFRAAAEHIRELGEELLDLRQSREVGSMAEGRLRGWRGIEN